MGGAGGDEYNRVEPCRPKKLVAGVRFGLSEAATGYNCKTCDERKRSARNCHNRKKYKATILQGVDEWRAVRGVFRPVEKWGDLKIYACPSSTISPRTWQILKLVNETTHPETTTITHLPFDGALLDQPAWFREAVSIVREERNAHRLAEMKKTRKDAPK